MRDKVREVLNQLDEVLSLDNPDSKELWNVLTALRGPDNDLDSHKFATTGLIRAKAFPKSYSKSYSNNLADLISGPGGSLGSKDTEGSLSLREDNLDYYGTTQPERKMQRHFKRHAENAFYVLDLDWLALNK